MSQSPSTQGVIPTILIADDNAVMRKIIVKILRQDAYRVIEARDGIEAIELYHSIQPDVVLLDGAMPGMDGFECCSHLRSLAPIHVLPILMITSLDDNASVNAAFDVGATDYIQKPIHWLVLRRRVRLLLYMAQLHRDLQAANEELKAIALMDGLTGLFNRRSLDDMLLREWNRSIRTEEPLSLIMMDVDYFKRFNDTYGHPAGDRCLQQIGQVIRSSIRWAVDIGARYGGEEFAIVLPNSGLHEATSVADRVRQGVKELHIPHQGTLVTAEKCVTLSIGVSSVYPSRSFSLDALIQDADQKLYQAKTLGRNQVVSETGKSSP